MGRRLLRCQIENQNWQFTVSRLQKFVRVVTNTGQTDKMRVNTVEAARLLGVKPTRLRLLLRQGKIEAPPITFDRKTNSNSRMWSEGEIEQARKALERIELIRPTED